MKLMVRNLFMVLLYCVYMTVMCVCGASLEVMTQLVVGGLIVSFLLCIAAWLYEKREKIKVNSVETALMRRNLWKFSKLFVFAAWMVAIFFALFALV